MLRLRSGAFVRHTQRWSLCAMPGGEEPEGGGGDPNGVRIEQCAQCLLPVGKTTVHFLFTGRGGAREVVAPLTTEEVVGVAGHLHQCPLAQVCHGEALPWPT